MPPLRVGQRDFCSKRHLCDGISRQVARRWHIFGLRRVARHAHTIFGYKRLQNSETTEKATNATRVVDMNVMASKRRRARMVELE